MNDQELISRIDALLKYWLGFGASLILIIVGIFIAGMYPSKPTYLGYMLFFVAVTAFYATLLFIARKGYSWAAITGVNFIVWSYSFYLFHFG